MAVLSNLQPEKVFYYFEKLCSVPHGSGNTKQISDLCVGFAKELGLKYRQEACNNVIIWKNGSCGYENAAPIILQGHIDMVCAKTEDCTKDMTRDGLDVMTDGEWVWADKTSLGGDNGIAVAMILAILSDETLPHPPIEAVFTVDEEVGMDGAFALDCSDLKGKKLLNLDSEEEGVFTVSCAGGVRLDCTLNAPQERADGMTGYRVTISGLKGGHSGMNINQGRGNANCLMARTLYSAMERCPSLRVSDLTGGQFDNVICLRNDALVALETNFSTYPVMKLLELGYPNQYRREREDTFTHRLRESCGFRTDRQTRPRAIANLVEVFSLHPEWFSDRELLGEMLTFCYNEDHRPEALAGKHDDLVMAAAICYAARHQQRMTAAGAPVSREEAVRQKERRRRIRRGRI